MPPPLKILPFSVAWSCHCSSEFSLKVTQRSHFSTHRDHEQRASPSEGRKVSSSKEIYRQKSPRDAVGVFEMDFIGGDFCVILVDLDLVG